MAAGLSTTRLTEVTGTTRDTGTSDVNGDRLVLHPDSGADVAFAMALDNAYLTLRREGVTYDFDGDGTARGATLFLRLDHF